MRPIRVPSKQVIAAAISDYVGGCRYAFSSDFKRYSDHWLHRSVVVSVLSIGMFFVQPAAVILSDQPRVNLFFAPVALAIGLLSAAWVVHRYRRRNYPESEVLTTVVNVALDKVHEARASRRSAKRTK